MTEQKDRPSIDERYTSATNATSLVVVPERSGAGDMLIAAGWSRNRLGTALMRLVSEWDASEKPRPVSREGIERVARDIAASSPGRTADDVTDTDRREARAQAARWLLHEQKILMGKLKTLPEVRRGLIAWITEQNLPEPQQTAVESLSWWLDATCRTCHGKRWQEIKDTARLSDKVCPACRGSGERPRPGGMQTNRVLVMMDDCVNHARSLMAKKLRRFAHHKESA
jgi:hypothetical protein